MKKKIALIVISAALLAALIALSACGNSTPAQSVLFEKANAIWGLKDGKEILTYDITRGDSEDTIGTYTLTGECVSNKNVTVGGDTLENVSGTYFTSVLDATETNDGAAVRTVIETQSYLTAGYIVQQSYRKVTVYSGDDVTVTEIHGIYGNKDYNYTYKQTVNGQENTKDGNVSHEEFSKSAYIDNDYMYQTVRLLASLGTSLSFSVPYYNYAQDGTLSTVTMEQASSSVQVTDAEITGMRGDYNKEGRKYYGVQMSVSLSRSFPGSGTSFSCYVINKYSEADTSYPVNDFIPGIIKEGDITYRLTSSQRV